MTMACALISTDFPFSVRAGRYIIRWSSKNCACLAWALLKDRMAMQLTQSMGVRMEQRQLLTPRMIQSMEILQLPLMALEERIEQELQNNPVLELREGGEEM